MSRVAWAVCGRRRLIERLGLRGFAAAASEQKDVVIIGGGPGGYVAAIKAAQLGLSVACVEGRGTLGGTCLNVGCIPSKALLQSSHMYAEAKHAFQKHGVLVDGVAVDVAAMQRQKASAVEGLTKGIEGLFKKNKARWACIVSSTGALSLENVPKSLVVIGGGYIGLELGSVWSRLGAEVTVVEFLDHIVPTMDGEVRRAFQRSLQKQGLKFKLGTKVASAEATHDGVNLTLQPAKGSGSTEMMSADVVLVSTGRRPYTQGLNLEGVGVATDKRGCIVVDKHFQTSVPGIHAIGDVIPGPMLAHKAEEDGVACVELLAGRSGHVNYDTVPSIVYTWPEVASVGKTEEQVKADGLAYKVGKFSFMANSRARSVDDTEGMVKFIADAKTDKIMGVHIMGPNAGELIGECVLAMEYGASAEDIARTCHGHPTLSGTPYVATQSTCGLNCAQH
ncbi:hypothetical protein COHA_010705 [Chlorella ohadii]|uniref:Dihydrolipoyl dehydrogenase n=1 Tax=Chlorella ohadii TaxID=2649997 RepID=A0AAD5DH85_9CHLO|nr:hypothetical protein COHA_010705 [Chlorella ohadii]